MIENQPVIINRSIYIKIYINQQIIYIYIIYRLMYYIYILYSYVIMQGCQYNAKQKLLDLIE